MFKNDVFELIRQSAYHYGVPKLATKMGLAPGTLYNKLNNDEGCSHHKLTLQDFIAILGITGDTAALQGLAGLFDHAVFPLPQMEQMGDDALLDMVNQVYVQGGRAHTVMAEALADGQVSEEEYSAYDLECRQWVAAIVALRRRFKNMVVIVNERRST